MRGGILPFRRLFRAVRGVVAGICVQMTAVIRWPRWKRLVLLGSITEGDAMLSRPGDVSATLFAKRIFLVPWFLTGAAYFSSSSSSSHSFRDSGDCRSGELSDSETVFLWRLWRTGR